MRAQGARQTRSLICWWRARRPMPSLHERPWVPMLSTHAPQLQECAAQMGVPSRKPIAILVSIRRRGATRTTRLATRVASHHCGVRLQRGGGPGLDQSWRAGAGWRLRARWKPDPNSSADVPHQLMAPSRYIVQSKSVVCERSMDPPLL